MARTANDRLLNARDRLRHWHGRGHGPVSNRDAELIRELDDAYADAALGTAPPEGESYRTAETRASWVALLTTVAREVDLATASADDLNALLSGWYDDGDGLSRATMRTYQSSLRRFYRYHDGLGVEPADIPIMSKDSSGGFDPADLLTANEIERAKAAIDGPRDNLIFHLLLYTGLRNTALRTLRVKDVDHKEGNSGRYRVNPGADGLKGAGDAEGEWRPLLGARDAVREWLKYHPDPESDNYLLTSKPGARKMDPTRPLTRETIRYTMAQIKERSGIEKPMHPHMMRHNFVTICKRKYDMDNDTIRWLIHHSPRSRVMETTYSHLSDEDWIQRAEGAQGYGAPENESPLSPPSCPTCGENLPPNAKACPRCASVFTPKGVVPRESRNTIKLEGDAAEAILGALGLEDEGQGITLSLPPGFDSPADS